MIGERIKQLKTRLEKVKRQRQTQRQARRRSGSFRISLVGYTNAGKSTLFNALVKARAYAADQLFATLDTTSRRVYLNDAQRHLVLSDTVGFIRDLPHALVAAFQATLEETAQADLLLHVVDSASPDRDQQIRAVDTVLHEIGALEVPQILVWNKIDLTAADPAIERDDCGNISAVRLSARSGAGLSMLREALAEVAGRHHDLPAAAA